ncbi:MAG: CHAT domain-containing protein [Cyclobacteriaceae bacterium]|nr:CHAT domain-containing protein [Cyclobacteriaceae bacterium]
MKESRIVDPPFLFTFSFKVLQQSRVGLLCFGLLVSTCSPKDSHDEKGQLNNLTLSQADSLFVLAEKLSEAGKRDSAIFQYDKVFALELQRPRRDTITIKHYLAAARLYQQENKYDIADKFLEKARLLTDSLEVRPRLLLDLYLASANAKSNLSDFAYASGLLREAGVIGKSYFSRDPNILYGIYAQLAGNYYYQKNIDSCLYYQAKAIATIFGNNARLSAAVHFKGIFLTEFKRYDEALANFNKALTIALRNSGANSDPVARIHLQKARAFQRSGLMDSSLFCLRENLRIRKKIYGVKNSNTYGAHYELGQFYYSIGAPDSALFYFQSSLISLVNSFNNHSFHANPQPSFAELNTDLVNALIGKARAVRSISPNKKNLYVSLKTYFLADSVFRLYRSNFYFDDLKMKQLDKVPYHEIAEVAFSLYEMEPQKVFVTYALSAIEQSRAALLLENLRKAENFGKFGVPEDLRKKERDLAQQYADLQYRLVSNGLNTDSVSKALLEVQNKMARLQNNLRENFGSYFRIRYPEVSVELPSVQDYLKHENSMLLEYLWSDSTLFVILLKPDTFNLRKIKIDKMLTGELAAYTNLLRTGPDSIHSVTRYKRFCQSSSFIYNRLVNEVLFEAAKKRQLIISADGPLLAMPFESLVTDTPDLNNSEINYQLNYLIRKQSIRYAYSISLMLQQERKKRSGDRLLAFGYSAEGPQTVRGAVLGGLPGSKLELEAVKHLMNNAANKYLLEAGASEAAFKREAGEFNIVHLAVHGVADSVQAMESKLIFTNRGSADEDGQLYSHELYGLDLKEVDLAVLSACESGVGKYQRGEGIMSMARAFAYAGCPSLVMSLWKIDDKISARIMTNFYEHLVGEEKIDKALAGAKLDYLSTSNEINSHPYYWAAFLLTGNSNPISKGTNWFLWISISIISVLTVALVLRHRFRS